MINLKLYINDILPKLDGLIKQKRLTEILKELEYLGYHDDDAIALLTYLQTEAGL